MYASNYNVSPDNKLGRIVHGSCAITGGCVAFTAGGRVGESSVSVCMYNYIDTKQGCIQDFGSGLGK